MKKIYILFFILTVSLCSQAIAAPHLADIKPGMTAKEMEWCEIGVCDPAVSNMLCGKVNFGGKEWNASFTMKADALSQISLLGEHSDEFLEAALTGFKDSPYSLSLVINEKSCFDFIEKSHSGLDDAQVKQAFVEFLEKMQTMDQKFIAYIYCDERRFSDLMADNTVKNFWDGIKTEKATIPYMSIDEHGVHVVIGQLEELSSFLAQEKECEPKQEEVPTESTILDKLHTTVK